MNYGALAKAILIAGTCLALLTASASAANPPLLAKTPEDGVPGSSAGHLDHPYGIASNPLDGHIYVSDSDNNRISEFTAWGVFVQAFGWGVADGSPEFQTCTSSCQAGIPGPGPGQLDSPSGIVSDEAGNVYVVDRDNLRVQKFTSTGDFLLMFGYEVDKTTGADVCTAADVSAGDVCGPGQEGTEPTQFSKWFFYSEGRTIAIGPSGDIYVGDEGRIQVFAPNGEYKEAINFSEVPGLPDAITKSLAIAPDGTLYIALVPILGSPATPDVYEVDPGTRELLGKIKVDRPELLTLDGDGNLYVGARVNTELEEVLVFDPAGQCLICLGDEFSKVNPIFEAMLSSLGTGSACGPTNVYVGLDEGVFADPPLTQVAIYGDPPDSTVCPPPAVPPTIAEQFASAVGTESAVLGAAINPHFWPDTTYYLEYGTEDCASSTCTKQPLPPGNGLGGGIVNSPVRTQGIHLQDLSPNTTYFYRFVAESGGGGPVIGPSAKFTTFQATPPAADTCPNAPFRFGAGSGLPDCRAYEMVSPLDKEGGDIMTLKNVFGFPASMNQSSLSGEKMTYSSARAFADPKSGPYTSQYIATRGPGGWDTEAISPPRNGPILERGQTTDTEFKAFTPDLCLAWLRHDTDPPLAEGAPEGYANLYRRDNCGGGTFEAMRTPAPGDVSAQEYEPELQGYSADGSVVIFAANDSLTADAPPLIPGQIELYESRDGEEPKYVCILPNGTPDTGGCSAGTYSKNFKSFGRTASVHNAISDDGSLVYWSDAPEPGRIYLRVNGEETLPVSAFAEGQAKTKASQFWAASADGSKAVITTGGRLYLSEPLAGSNTLLASQVKGVMGVSEDAEDIYFVSEEGLDGAGAGKPNLYHYEREGEVGEITFVMEVAASDAREVTFQQIPSPVNVEPVKHTARVTADGQHLAFMSNLRPALGGFDNSDVKSGEPDAEVYLYDATSEEVHCVSCNRTGARPIGKDLEVGGFTTGLWAAAKIQPWQNQLNASRILAADGSRLFFESTDVLVPRDTNEQMDVYQWETVGTGGCSESLSTYNPAAGGCVDLISSGKSPFPSEFIDADPSGQDAFFGTLSGLVPQDYGLVDIYDARELGGFSPPSPPAPECEGSACQSPPPAPQAPTPSSANFSGPGSPPQKAKKHCPKGKRAVKKKGRIKCVKKKSAKKKGRTAR